MRIPDLSDLPIGVSMLHKLVFAGAKVYVNAAEIGSTLPAGRVDGYVQSWQLYGRTVPWEDVDTDGAVRVGKKFERGVELTLRAPSLNGDLWEEDVKCMLPWEQFNQLRLRKTGDNTWRFE